MLITWIYNFFNLRQNIINIIENLHYTIKTSNEPQYGYLDITCSTCICSLFSKLKSWGYSKSQNVNIIKWWRGVGRNEIMNWRKILQRELWRWMREVLLWIEKAQPEVVIFRVRIYFKYFNLRKSFCHLLWKKLN